MKKFILLAAAATLFAVPANAAPNNHRGNAQKAQKAQKTQKRVVQRVAQRNVVQARNTYRQPVQVRNVYRQPVQVRNVYRAPVRQVAGHRWARGQHFDQRYATNYRVISNYGAYHLNAPPRGYRYVQSGNDIVLVAIASGIIGAIFGNLL